MTEPRMMVLLVAGPALWMLGGYRWSWMRRFLWPGLAMLCLPPTGFWTRTAVGLTLMVVNSLGYGDRTRWPRRVLVFGALGLGGVWLDPLFGVWWGLGTALALSLGAYLSRRVNRVTWTLWEALAGFWQAGGLVLAVLPR